MGIGWEQSFMVLMIEWFMGSYCGYCSRSSEYVQVMGFLRFSDCGDSFGKFGFVDGFFGCLSIVLGVLEFRVYLEDCEQICSCLFLSQFFLFNLVYRCGLFFKLGFLVV